MDNAFLDVLVAKNPATGAELGQVPTTSPDEVDGIVTRAREAQKRWGALPWKERAAVLKRWMKIIARDADSLADLIRDEIGKPRSEALGGDVIGTLDAFRWTLRNGAKALKGESFGKGNQRFLQMPRGRLEHRALGVIGMIGTWNYPFFLNVPVIAQALAAGNAVVWKPSEYAPLTGLRIALGIDEAKFPDGLVETVFGGAEVGQALVASAIDKVVFTGGVGNGRRILAALGTRGIPAVAELSGYDPAIVMANAKMKPTVRELVWGAFLNAGQTCVAVKRAYIVGNATPWAEALADQARKLRVGSPTDPKIDVGPMISESARDRFHEMVQAAINAGAKPLCGSEPIEGEGSFYPPTVLLAQDDEPEKALAGAFGPVIIVRGMRTSDEAVKAANASEFALGASVFSRDKKAARAVAAKIDAGMVTINEAVTPTAHAATPFGGFKSSGYGRTHGAIGLREFTAPQVVFTRKLGGFRPHLFPYGRLPVEFFLRLYRRLFH